MWHKCFLVVLLITDVLEVGVNADRPSLFLNRDELDRLRRELKTVPWKREFYEKDVGRTAFIGGAGIRPNADRWLGEAIEIPARGGHFHDFYCEDGNILELPPDSKPRPEGYRCTVCGRVYKGEKYDAAVRWRLHNELAVAAFDLALVYALENDIRYADKSAEILLKYANAYPGPHTGPTTGGIMYQSLCEAVWVIPLAAAYDFIYDSGVLSEADKQRIEGKLFRPVAEGLKNMGIGGNWGSWHLSAVGVIGYAIRDEALVGYALSGFKRQISEVLGDDGIWPESVHTYHFYPLSAFLYLAEAAYHNGTDLYHWEAKPGKGLKSMYLAPINYMYPNFQLPAINDGWFKSFLPLSLYELAYARYDDANIAWVLATGYETLRLSRSGLWAFFHGRPLTGRINPPLFKSTNFPVLGIATLRSAAGNMMTFDYGPHLGHGQLDKMGVTLFANGSPLVLDYGTPGYGSAIMRWYRSTPAHNTVVVDTKDQCPTKERRLTCFETGELFEVAEAETEEAYPGVLHRRAVIRVGEYFVVRDTLESEEEHTYDWFFRCEGDLSMSMVPDAAGPPQDYSYLEYVNSFSPRGRWQARWESKEGGLALFMLDDGPSAVFSALCPAESGTRKVSLVVARRTGRSATFTCVLFPYRGRLRAYATLEAGLIKFSHDGLVDLISVEPKTANRELTTDGKYALVRMDSQGVMYSRAFGGTLLGIAGQEAPRTTVIERDASKNCADEVPRD